jgi:hypothetical protein
LLTFMCYRNFHGTSCVLVMHFDRQYLHKNKFNLIEGKYFEFLNFTVPKFYQREVWIYGE